MQIRSFQPADESAVIDLWTRCEMTRPWNDPHRDIQRKLQVQPELFLVGVLDGKIVATAMLGYDGHRGWLYYFCVAPEHRRTGLGRQIMAEAERLLIARGCPKLNLEVRTTNTQVLDFYRRIGYVPNDVVSLGKRLIADE